MKIYEHYFGINKSLYQDIIQLFVYLENAQEQIMQASKQITDMQKAAFDLLYSELESDPDNIIPIPDRTFGDAPLDV